MHASFLLCALSCALCHQPCLVSSRPSSSPTLKGVSLNYTGFLSKHSRQLIGQPDDPPRLHLHSTHIQNINELANFIVLDDLQLVNILDLHRFNVNLNRTRLTILAITKCKDLWRFTPYLPATLTHLDLSENAIKFVAKRSFVGLTKLSVVNLESNQLVAFENLLYNTDKIVIKLRGNANLTRLQVTPARRLDAYTLFTVETIMQQCESLLRLEANATSARFRLTTASDLEVWIEDETYAKTNDVYLTGRFGKIEQELLVKVDELRAFKLVS